MGGPGADTIEGGDGDDTVQYLGSTASVRVDLAAPGTQIGGHAAADVLREVEHVRGSSHGDTITGSASDNWLQGHAGDDDIRGHDGGDVLWGGAGDDTIRGDGGDDRIKGGDERDWIDGGDGNDVILGGNDRDRIEGGDGDDTIEGGADNDAISGGDGDDVFVFSGRFDVDTIEDFEDGDAIAVVGLDAGTLEPVIASASAAGTDADGLYTYEFDGGSIRVAVLLAVGDFDLS